YRQKTGAIKRGAQNTHANTLVSGLTNEKDQKALSLCTSDDVARGQAERILGNAQTSRIKTTALIITPPARQESTIPYQGDATPRYLAESGAINFQPNHAQSHHQKGFANNAETLENHVAYGIKDPKTAAKINSRINPGTR
mgnify:CR=1